MRGGLRPTGRRARQLMAAGAVVVLVGGGYAAYATVPDSTSYRTAEATIGSVDETVSLSGTVEPAGRADLSFATAGTIADITVRTGAEVERGDVLGSLATRSLRNSVRQARSTLASAKARLAADKESQSSTVTSATTGTAGASGGTPVGGSSDDPPTQEPTQEPSQEPSQEPTGQPTKGDGGTPVSAALAAALTELSGQQDAVISAQSAVSDSLAAATVALTAQQNACASAFGSGGEADPADPDPTADDAANAACTAALTEVQVDQAQVATDQDALQQALDTLAGTLSAAVDTVEAAEESSSGTTGGGSSPATPSTPATPSSSSSPSTPSAGTDPSQSAGTPAATVTAATLARDQADIDAARVTVIEAEQQLRLATIKAPFSGRIVAVDARVGDSVAAGTQVFTLISEGMTTVQVAVTSTQAQQLKVGQRATATPAGATEALRGTVAQISSIPDDDSTYPVTITLTKRDLDVPTGLGASVSVVTGSAEDVVTVPASALSSGSVQVVDDGVATRTRVTVGVVGATTVEITDGLAKGDEVVLADLDAALPSGDADTETNTRTPFGGTGGFGGNGGPPAGFRPPGQ